VQESLKAEPVFGFSGSSHNINDSDSSDWALAACHAAPFAYIA